MFGFFVNEKRGLAAGFHLVEGFFRDDRPLVEKVLSEAEREQLDLLWRDLEFVTQSAETLIRGFVWFERSERHVLHDKRFDFLRPEDPELVKYVRDDGSESVTFPLLDRFERHYLDRNGIKRIDDSLKAEQPDQKYEMIHGFFRQIRSDLQSYDELMKSAERRGLTDVERFAQRAFRRALRPDESESAFLRFA